MNKLFFAILLDFMIASIFGAMIGSIQTSLINLYAQKSFAPFDPQNSFIMAMLTTSATIGATIGSASSSFFAQRFGRKRSVIVTIAGVVIVQTLTFIPAAWGYWCFLRCVLGCFCQAMVSLAPAWFVEISGSSFLNQFFELFIAVGLLLQNSQLLIIVDHANLWSISLVFGMVVSIIGFVLCFMVKEAVKPVNTSIQDVVITTNDVYEDNVQPDLLTSDVLNNTAPQEEQTKIIKSQKTLLSPEMRRSLINAIFLGTGTQGNGICVFTSYITLIFEKVFGKTDTYRSSAYGTLIMCIFKVIGCLLPLFFISKVKRRLLFFIGYFGTIPANIIMAVAYAFSEDSVLRPLLVILATVLFMLAFEFGPGTLTYVICGEIFPSSVQNQLSSVVFASMCITNIIIAFSFAFFKQFPWAAYLIYAIYTILTGAVLFRTLPESFHRPRCDVEAEVTRIQ